MGRASVKEDKSVYQLCREGLGLSREAAAEKLEYLSADRLEKIENGRTSAQPEDVMCMAKGYSNPSLCNYYCTHECPIGIEFVPEIKNNGISQTVLEMLNTLTLLTREKDRLVEIMVDGKLSEEEKTDFEEIKKNLDDMQSAITELKFWASTVK